MPEDRYIPDLSEVPPDPADPIAIGVDPGHNGGTRVSVWAVKPDPTGKMRPTLIAVSDAVAACPDPAHPCIVSVGVGSGPPPDVGMPNHATLHLKPRSESAVLSAHRRFVGEHLHRLTGANSPADGDPPRIARPPLTDAQIEAALEPLRRDIEQAGGRLEWGYTESAPLAVDAVIAAIEEAAPAPQGPPQYPLMIPEAVWKRIREEGTVPPWPKRDALIAREQAAVFERHAEPRGALTYPDAGRVWLPSSPVVQAALVVDPEE